MRNCIANILRNFLRRRGNFIKLIVVRISMLVKLLGVLDLLGAVLIILLNWGIGSKIGFAVAVLLGIKSLIFLCNWASIIDLVSVSILVLAAFGHYYSFSWLFALWLLQKAFFSFVS